MKKISAIVLVAIMFLSFMVSVAAKDSLKRVPSTIPGTNREYNYIENVTVKIPNTNVTFDFENVASFVFVNPEYTSTIDGKNIPAYRFVIFDSEGKATVNQNGSWFYFYHYNLNETTGNFVEVNKDYCFDFDENLNTLAEQYDTVIYSNNVCNYTDEFFYDGIINDDAIAIVQILCVNSTDDFESETDYYDAFYSRHDRDKVVFDETIDISLLDVNYKINKNYEILDGANTVVNSDSKSLTIRADGEFSKFNGVKIDGEFVDSSNYTASEGSTIIDFHDEYLRTLSAGKHTVAVVFSDGEATTQFEIKSENNMVAIDKTDKVDKIDVEIPNTDANSHIIATLMIMAFSGGIATSVYKKKKYNV